MERPLLPSVEPEPLPEQQQRRRRWELVVCLVAAVSYALTAPGSRNALLTAKGPITHVYGPTAYGNINAVGYATYGAGKLVYGMVVDLPAIGGRVAFLYCMLGTGLCTAAMSLCDSELQLALAWGLARATQAAGWIGMVKIVVAWTPASRLGRVMALCSLATYVGDFATRLLIGAVLAGGVDWRSVFWLSGAVIGVLFVGTVALLKPSPESLGLPKVAANPHRVVQAEAPGTFVILRQLSGSAEFWLVLGLSVCCTTAREAFNTNSAALLADQGASDAAAAALSAAFPLMGVPACLFFGWIVDKYDRRKNGEILAASMTLLLVIMALLCAWLYRPVPGLGVPDYVVVAVLLLAAGFALIGPYSLLAGVFAGDLGGPAAAATACSLIDFAGYCGSIVLMLVGDRGPFADGYLLLFAVFGAGAAAASLGLSCVLVCAKRRSRRQ